MAGYASGKYSLGVCDRCARTVPFRQLRRDGDSPGLRVCGADSCYDNLDPHKLPPRQLEPIVLMYPRPDVNLGVGILVEEAFQDNGFQGSAFQ